MKLTLNKIQKETGDAVSYIFKATEVLQWKAGQYFHYVLHHEPTDDRGSDRWFTVASAPFEQDPMITTRINSDKSSSFKKKLQSLEIGKSIEISVVGGSFVVVDSSKQYVFIAGGIGITPFRSILKQLEHEKKEINVTLLYANRNQDIVYKDELEAITAHNNNFKIHYIISPEKIDENKIKELVNDLQTPLFYISGPEPMVEALEETLQKMNITDDHIKKDSFPGYAGDLS